MPDWRTPVKKGDSVSAQRHNEMLQHINHMTQNAGHESIMSPSFGVARRRQPTVSAPTPCGPTQWVRVIHTGEGDAGGPHSQCTFPYDLYPLTGPMTAETRIATAIDNVPNRPERGRFVAAHDGTYAEAYFGANPYEPETDEWVLLNVTDEVEATYPCDCSGP